MFQSKINNAKNILHCDLVHFSPKKNQIGVTIIQHKFICESVANLCVSYIVYLYFCRKKSCVFVQFNRQLVKVDLIE